MKYGKPDANHLDIKRLYERIPGCAVFDTKAMGGGFPDLVVLFMGIFHLIEVKDGNKPPSKQKLTEAEKKFHKTFACDYLHIVSNTDEAYMAIGIDPTASIPF